MELHCDTFYYTASLQVARSFQLKKFNYHSKTHNGTSTTMCFGDLGREETLFYGQYLCVPGQYPFIFSPIYPDTLTRLIYSNDLRDGETMVVRNPKPSADLGI
ncbi:hypothetical protein C8R43DRAFT_1244575 [Mycena crocata]|nr:hypothetical protein C8R43DRAFT_1244575 [Mycena crocata]